MRHVGSRLIVPALALRGSCGRFGSSRRDPGRDALVTCISRITLAMRRLPGVRLQPSRTLTGNATRKSCSSVPPAIFTEPWTGSMKMSSRSRNRSVLVLTTCFTSAILASGPIPTGWTRQRASTMAREISRSGLPRIARSRPRVCCVGLNNVAMPGNLMAVDMPAQKSGYEILGEWPRREQPSS